MPTIDIDGHPTWYADSGSAPGVPVLLLHGGVSNSDLLLDTIGGPIGRVHRVVAFDRRGHGRTADTDAPFHYAEMADETVAVLDGVVGEPAHLIGWSDGGIVALLVALRRPDLVDRLVLIGVNFHHEGTRPISMPEDAPFAAMIQKAYAERSPHGAEHFAVAMEKCIALITTEPTLTTADIAGVTAPTLVMAGDDDLIEPAHTLALYRALPAGRLAVVPGTSHALPMERPDEVVRLVIDFLAAADPPDTLMPVDRA
jgi:pimeloyl-ACP methyl ester carboxylesterase